MEDRNKFVGGCGQAPQLDPDVNNFYSASSTDIRSGHSQAVFNPNFIANRAKRVVANRQDNHHNFVGKSQNKEGFDVVRLVHPSIDQINEDFLCAIC